MSDFVRDFPQFKRTLHLSLKWEPFEVMVIGEKTFEYRKPTKWILSRLPDGTFFYSHIKFTNGYGPNRPYFICEPWIIHRQQGYSMTKVFSNGLTVNVVPGDIVIGIRNITEIGNCDVRTIKKNKKWLPTEEHIFY